MDNSCNKTSNNKYFDLPARMDDGRTFTDYRPSNTVDDMIRYSNNVMSSYEYRQFLINNGTKIMGVNSEYINNKIGLSNCNAPTIPFNGTFVINDKYATYSTVDKNGVGIDNIVIN